MKPRLKWDRKFKVWWCYVNKSPISGCSTKRVKPDINGAKEAYYNWESLFFGSQRRSV